MRGPLGVTVDAIHELGAAVTHLFLHLKLGYLHIRECIIIGRLLSGVQDPLHRGEPRTAIGVAELAGSHLTWFVVTEPADRVQRLAEVAGHRPVSAREEEPLRAGAVASE